MDIRTVAKLTTQQIIVAIPILRTMYSYFARELGHCWGSDHSQVVRNHPGRCNLPGVRKVIPSWLWRVSLDVRYFVVKEAWGFIGQMPQGLPVMNNFVTFDMKLSELNIARLIRGVE